MGTPVSSESPSNRLALGADVPIGTDLKIQSELVKNFEKTILAIRDALAIYPTYRVIQVECHSFAELTEIQTRGAFSEDENKRLLWTYWRDI